MSERIAFRGMENPQSIFGSGPYCLDSADGKTVKFLAKLGAWLARTCAGVVELADTGDLKSPDPQGLCGFDPRLRQLSSHALASCSSGVAVDAERRTVSVEGLWKTFHVA
jgi:hypothetical protein